MPREITEIVINEHGDETHESWIKIGANHVSATPGQHLFDSEIAHQHYIKVTVWRCSRKRDLSHDWLYADTVILEMNMSSAQWGAFVSSFGQGGGVPTTLSWFNGAVPQAPHTSRLGESTREVRASGEKALESITESYDALLEAFERGAGKKEMREKIRDLGFRVGSGPSNMEFAAKTLIEHTENVVTKARADIEAMIAAADDSGNLTLSEGSTPLLEAAPES